MNKTSPQPEGADALNKPSAQLESVDTMMNGLVAATQGGRAEAQQAWARTCDAYARYFSALARADGPGAILAAQAELLTDGMDVATKNATALQRLATNGRSASVA